jgi:hypothetical protein
MALTVGQLKAHVRLAAGGDPSTFPGYTVEERVVEIINHAGQHLYSHSWRFRERTTKALDLVANQGWIDLPADAGELVNVTAREPFTYAFRILSPQEFASHAQSTTVVPVGYLACLSHAASDDGQPTPRLDLFPVPAANDTGAVLVRYRVKWPTITTATADSVQVQVANYAEHLLVEYVRAFAEGGEDGTTQARVAAVDLGPVTQSAKGQDGTLHDSYGSLPMRRRFSRGGGPMPWGYVALRPVSDVNIVAATYAFDAGSAAFPWVGPDNLNRYQITVPASQHLLTGTLSLAFFDLAASPSCSIAPPTVPLNPGDSATGQEVGLDGTVTIRTISNAAKLRVYIIQRTQ